MNAIENYRILLEKIEGKSKEIVGRYPEQINCGKGCHSCCLHGLSVNGIERESIKQHLEKTPGLLAATRKNVKDNPFKGQRCMFLDAGGACMIYEARPVVCRSHGMPLKIAQKSSSEASDTAVLDVCPLNFTDMALADVGEHYLINLETLNTLLVLLNQQFDLKNAEKRHLLSPELVQDIS